MELSCLREGVHQLPQKAMPINLKVCYGGKQSFEKEFSSCLRKPCKQKHEDETDSTKFKVMQQGNWKRMTNGPKQFGVSLCPDAGSVFQIWPCAALQVLSRTCPDWFSWENYGHHKPHRHPPSRAAIWPPYTCISYNGSTSREFNWTRVLPFS